MGDVKKIIVSDYYDGFSVDLFLQGDKTPITFYFDQEDTREKMKELFETLGVKNVIYQEVC